MDRRLSVLGVGDDVVVDEHESRGTVFSSSSTCAGKRPAAVCAVGKSRHRTELASVAAAPPRLHSVGGRVVAAGGGRQVAAGDGVAARSGGFVVR